MPETPESLNGEGGGNLPQTKEALDSLVDDIKATLEAHENLLTKLDNDGALNDTDYDPSESASLTFEVGTTKG